MGTAVHPASTTPASWDAFTDVDAFVDEVLAELAVMAAGGTRATRPGPHPAVTGAALRKAIIALGGARFLRPEWPAIGQVSRISFGNLYTLFSRLHRLGLA